MDGSKIKQIAVTGGDNDTLVSLIALTEDGVIWERFWEWNSKIEKFEPDRQVIKGPYHDLVKG